ncbi:MAG: hypothetical protein ACI8R8_003099 [Paraglaciecola sp.]|jgi:uncharacterized protein YdgA (DUF945 family)
MKKTLLVGASIILLVAVIAPKIVSNSFNQKLDSVVELINQNPVYNVSIKYRTSDWFSSTATINVGLDSSTFNNNVGQEAYNEMQGVFANMNIDVVIDAQHGPILTQNGLALGWLTWNARVDGNTLRETLEFEANTPFYQITSHTSLLGASSYTDKIPSFQIKDDEVFTQLSFSGWNGFGTFSDSETRFQGMLETVSVNSAFGKFELNQWSVDSKIQGNLMDAMAGNFQNSTMSMQIQDITFEQATDQAKTAITEIGMHTNSKFDEATSLLDTEINFSLKELTTAELNVSSVIVNTEINNLKEHFFQAYQTLMNQLSKEPEKMQENLDNFMQTELLGQLQAEPEFNISSFQAKINQGNITGSLNSKLEQVTKLPDAIESPVFWLQHLMITGQINVDKSAALWLAIDTIKSQIKSDPSAAQMTKEEIAAIAAQQAPAMLQGIQQQGMFTETATGYQLQFSLADGQALLNGDPMALPIGQ